MVLYLPTTASDYRFSPVGREIDLFGAIQSFNGVEAADSTSAVAVET